MSVRVEKRVWRSETDVRYRTDRKGEAAEFLTYVASPRMRWASSDAKASPAPPSCLGQITVVDRAKLEPVAADRAYLHHASP